jgi:hypothetical protein
MITYHLYLCLPGFPGQERALLKARPLVQAWVYRQDVKVWFKMGQWSVEKFGNKNAPYRLQREGLGYASNSLTTEDWNEQHNPDKLIHDFR